MSLATATALSSSSSSESVDLKYSGYALADLMKAVKQFYHSSTFITLLLFTAIYLLSGNYSLILCNVLCTLPPGILTYFQLANKNDIIKKSIIVYWIICGISFTCDSIYASINGYSYIKTITLMLLFHYCMMKNVENNKFDNTIFGNTRNLIEVERHAKEWIANVRSEYESTSKDITSDSMKRTEITLDSFKTISKENCIGTDLRILKLNHATINSVSQSKITTNESVTKDERIETAKQSLPSTATIKRTFDKNHQSMENYMDNSANNTEGLVSFPNSQVTIRSEHSGPVILAFTNNYKKPLIWALKTNAIKRLAAFPTTGIIPPLGTVQIKIDLIGEIPKIYSKDRLSFEYFITNRKVLSDPNYLNYFHHQKSFRMKKYLKIVYI